MKLYFHSISPGLFGTCAGCSIKTEARRLWVRDRKGGWALGEADGSRKTLTDEDGKCGRSDWNDQLSQY